MKLRIYFTPVPVVVALVVLAGLLWVALLATGWWLLPFAAFYSVLAALSLWALLRLSVLEREYVWSEPQRLLILAPHEDDCTIAAGGIGVRNGRLGGVTRVVYLAPDETPGMPEIRVEEARAAWAYAGLAEKDLHHLPLLPKLRQRDPQMLREAAQKLRALIDDFRPTVIVAPMFEGGHVHHDMLAALLGRLVTRDDTFQVFEAPEYSPYVSLDYTPHRVIALCTRWLFGLVSYYGPPDGIDSRPVERLRLARDELDIKRRMLACFASQNGPSLAVTCGYPDRLVRMNFQREWRQPFDFTHSYLRLALAARRVFPGSIAARLLPGGTGTIGRDGAITDWQSEWAEPG
jgi:LmbE family N-acetylglucosaminyl deacetylase